MITQEELLESLDSEWPASFALQTKTKEERHDIIFIQQLKKNAAKEIRRLQGILVSNEFTKHQQGPVAEVVYIEEYKQSALVVYDQRLDDFPVGTKFYTSIQ